MLDLEVRHSAHNFALSNGVITSNSHSAGYAYTAYQMAYLKTYYPAEFMAAQLSAEGWASEHDTVEMYWRGAKDMGIKCLPLDVNASKPEHTVEGSKDKPAIRRGFWGIRGIGREASKDIAKGQPYKDFFDFCKRAGAGSDSGVCISLMDNDAFKCFVPKLEKRLGRTVTAMDLEAEYKDQSERAKKEKNEKGARKEEKERIGIAFPMDDDDDNGDKAKGSENFSIA